MVFIVFGGVWIILDEKEQKWNEKFFCTDAMARTIVGATAGQGESLDEPRATSLKDCRYGRMLFLRRDQYVGRSLELYGEFSQLEAELFDQFVRPGETVIEVGANIGAHTIHLARLVGPKGLVVAYEPQRVIYHLLCANLALNELNNVHTYRAAVGAAPGMVTLPPIDYGKEGNFGGVSMRVGTPGEQVPVFALDRLQVASLRLLKIDVEGMEADVIEGARQLIQRHQPILYVENDRRENSARLIALLEALGYDMWWHMPLLFNPNNFAGNKEDVFPGTVSINLLCVPKSAGITVNGDRKVTGPDDWWQKPRA
jgi:FkbM family methyltransferase